MPKSQLALICSLGCCLVTRLHAQSPSMSVSQRQVWSILMKPDYFENRRVENGSGVTFSGIQCQQTASACFCSFRESETVFWLLEQLTGVLSRFVCDHFPANAVTGGVGGCYNQLSLFWLQCLDPVSELEISQFEEDARSL